ncbi:helix-turn-helix domain-containing protein [Acetobacter conturbans]|uniref:DUF4115 domain-containing protein n=1 Tax=Acetobacter conturbans TaxID=1737472 RepID=A0ABX0JW88_9PROT|nr:helix-turn-helix domain-containing protein [Acetobacter conturbans]NHN87043.1 DUF4115 domain-containing protein [Acetobacter conturbans]
MSVETSNRLEEDTVKRDGEEETIRLSDPANESVDLWSTPLPDFHSLGVGHALRLRREALGWSLPDVAAWLCIRQPYLEALEHDRADTIPAGAYALGFLRTYADALGFPAEKVVERFKREVRGVSKKPELTFLTPQPEKTVPAGALVFVGLLVIVGAYIGWYRTIGHDPVQLEQVPSVASVMPGMGNKAVPSPQIASVMPDVVPSSPSVPSAIAPQASNKLEQTLIRSGQSGQGESAFAGNDAPAGAFPQQLNDTQSGQGAGELSSAVGNATVQNVPELSSSPNIPKPAAIKATAKSWIQVKTSDGKVVYDHIMEPDEAWAFPLEGGPFTLTVGNAGGVALSVDDVMTEPLGKNGAVRRNIAVTEAAIRDGSISPLTTQISGTTAPASIWEPKESVSSPDEEPQIPLPPPPMVKPKVRRADPVAPEGKEISADDLNARQLKNIGGTAASPHM